MAKPSRHVPFYLLAELLQFLLILEAAKTNALSIKLIHKHSIDSPFYPGNITNDERTRLQIQSASSYTTRLLSDVSLTESSNKITTKMHHEGLMYLVQVGIGTFAPPHPRSINYFLHLDTTSNILWTQCEECQKMGPDSCFRQQSPLFPAKTSSTYHPLPCGKHSLCFPGKCMNGICAYNIKYEDEAASFGYLALESLTFDSDRNKAETINDVVFGCGIHNKGFDESSNNYLAAGKFALGPGEHNFLRQKQSLTQGRFSYCLPPWDVAHKTTIFLRFGAHIPKINGLQETTLITRQGSASYYVNMKGISVGNKKLNIPEKTFTLNNNGNGNGNCVIDSGAPLTLLPPVAYKKLKETLMKDHFSKYKKTRNQLNMDLCYTFPRNIELKDLPTITFHLHDADLVFPPHAGFWTFGKINFCLGMSSHHIAGKIYIGALQQTNKRFIFDIVKHKLYFGHEDCSRGA